MGLKMKAKAAVVALVGGMMGLIAILLLLAPTTTYSGNPKADFKDDALLAKAVLDIQEMPREELNTFISYLSSCGATKGGQIQEFFCSRDREEYLLKYDRGRSIDRLIIVLNIEWGWVEACDKVAKPKSKEREEMFESIMRYAYIMKKFRETANLRFQQLYNK